MSLLYKKGDPMPVLRAGDKVTTGDLKTYSVHMYGNIPLISKHTFRYTFVCEKEVIQVNRTQAVIWRRDG